MANVTPDRPLPQIDPFDTSKRFEMGYVRKAFVLGLIAMLLVGCFIVLRPFIAAILWAVILTFSTWPLYSRLERTLGGRTTLAAVLMTLLVMLLLVGPLVILGLKLSENVFRMFEVLHGIVGRDLPALPPWLAGVPMVGEQLNSAWIRLASGEANLRSILQPYLGDIRDWVLAAGGNLLSGTSLIAVSVFIAFFLYRDGRAAVRRLHNVMGQIAGARARQSLDVAAETMTGVVHGVLGTALVQAIAAAAGYWFTGVPGAFLLGFVTFFLTLIPMGPVILWLPATAWLMSHGDSINAIVLVFWVGLVVGGLDNFLRPILIGRSSALPFIVIFLGIVGGLVAFGLIGVFLGPTLLSVAYGLIREWSGGSERTERIESGLVGTSFATGAKE
ncbi:AI-2E family transporter [Azospirillum sp. CT11-132]|jgi:predicted PurR-regulated permease PerM|uniref:AI-2E family transporter n=1 Tax=Azospirillum sp. CT11-132 TaxID=3396317 RepID=UPI0039A48583